MLFGADFNSIGVRMPNNYSVKSILNKINYPVVATSVNISGEKAISKGNEIDKLILNQVDFFVNDDKICNGSPSTIIDVRFENKNIIRK